MTAWQCGGQGFESPQLHPLSGWARSPTTTWELYHTQIDRAELPRPRRRASPGGLAELIGLWFARGRRQPGVPPRRPRRRWRSSPPPRPAMLAPPRNRYVYRRAGPRSPSRSGGQHPQPLLLDRSTGGSPRTRGSKGCCSRTAAASVGTPCTSKHNRLRYEYSFLGSEEQRIVATEDLPTGENLILAASFDKDGEEPPGIAHGILTLYYGDRKVGEGRIETQPGKFSIAGEGLCAGRDTGEPVTDDYPGNAPWAVHRRHPEPGGRRRQRRTLRRPRTRGRRHALSGVASRHHHRAAGPCPPPNSGRAC